MMKKILSIILVILMITGSFAIAATFDASAEDGWELVWNDEFSGNTLDTTKWENMNTKKSAPRPKESEVQEDNAYVEDGKLIIKNEIGKCEPGSSAKYTTARLMTMDMFKYGKFEIRAKCAEATGTNSAFWTWGFPNDPNYKFHYWPKGQFEWTYGEIDLMERFNAVEWNNANYRTIKSQLHFIGPYKDKSGTVHTNKSEWSKTTYDSVKPGDVKSELSTGQDYGTSWHTFGCEWNADEIKLFRDGIQYGTLDLRFKSDTYPTAADAMDVFREYCQKFIISDWMGSYGPVSGDSTFQIDYFRVWQKPGCLINYNEYGTSAYNSAKKVQTMDTNLATSEEVYYQPELKGNASYTIFDADASSVNYPTAPQGAIANSIASKEKRNALRIKRTSQYDNVCIQFPGDYSSVAQKAKYLRMWVACDEGAMYYADQKGGVSYGFRTTDGKYYFANGEKGLNYCSSNVSYFGNYHWVDLSNLKLTETDVNKYDSCGDRLKDVKGGQTTSFSSIAGKIDAVYVNFGVISGMGNATGVNDCYYIDDLEFVNDATVGTTSSTSASTSKSTVTTTTTKSSDTATNVSVYNNSKIKLLGRAFQVGSKYSSGMASANSSVCLPWAGDGIEYSYTSSNKSSLTAKVAVGGSTYGKTSFTLLVDGVENGYYYINSTATDTQFQEYTLTFNNLPSGTHTARLVRRDKNFAAAHTYLKSLSFNGTLNNAPATSNLKIEFIGDSITVGDGLSEAEGNDITKAWAYLTAKGVNAEYSIVGKEGYNTQKILDQNLYKSWSTVANNIDYSPTKKANMVIINLGTNPDNNEDTFYSNAVKLINIVRNIHGSNVKVLWVYNMMTAQYLSKMQLLKTNGYVNGVVELKRDTSGHNGHPTAKGQLESANILINYLKTNYNYNGTTQTESSTTTTTTTKSPSSSSSSTTTTTTTKSGQVVSGEKVLNWNSQSNYYCSGTSSKKEGSITVSNSSTSSATRIINSWGNNVSAYDGIKFTVTANSGSSSDIQIELGGYETGYKALKSGSNEFVIDFKECGIDPSAVSDINFYANGAYNFTISDIIGYKKSVAPSSSSSSTTTTTKSGETTSGKVIFDAENPTYPNPLRSAGWNINNQSSYIVTKGDRKALKITRTSQYDNISAEWVGNFSKIASSAEKLQVWLSGDENAMLTTSVKGGFSFGFQTNDGNFYFASSGTDCSYNITTGGGVYSVDLRDLKVMKAKNSAYTDKNGVVYSNRLCGIEDWTKLDFSTIADKLSSVILNFGSIQSISPAAYKGTSFYVDDLEFVGGQNESSTTITTKPTQQDKTVTIDGVKIENDGNEFTLPVSTKDGFVAYFDGTSFYDANTKVALDTDKTFTTVAIGKLQMLKGASIRLGDVSGMRFFTVADPDMLDKLPAGTVVSKGTLITPVDLLGGEELTLDSTCQKLNVLYQSNSYYQNGNTFVGSIVNIKDSNITREFIGRGYITITYGDFTKTIYAESNDNARSIAYIASVYKSDSQSGYSSLSPSLKELVDKWASKYVDANDSNIDFEDNDASMVTLVGTDVSAEIVDKNNSKMLCVKHTKDYDYLGSDKYARIAVDAGSATDITFDAFYEGWATKEAHYGIEVNGVQYWDQSWDNGKITKVSKNYSVLNETFTELNGKFGVEGVSSLKITADNIKSIDAILIRPINYQDGQVVYVDNIKVVK